MSHASLAPSMLQQCGPESSADDVLGGWTRGGEAGHLQGTGGPLRQLSEGQALAFEGQPGLGDKLGPRLDAS